MRRIVVGFMSTISALVLLFSYHTSLAASSSSASAAPASTGPAAPSDGTTSGSAATSTATPSASAASTATGSTASSSSSSTASSGTFTGEAADTRWGVVQVKITVKNGKITQSEAVQYPTENGRDQEINAYAVPQLNSEVVAKQSATIDAVSGATVTSGGYLQSLQSAIDQANL
jgi:uncharacterized protein with FMN-binding domain